MPGVDPVVVDDLLKPVLLKDLRIQCRARGLNPGGSRETLVEKVKNHMLETGDLTLVAEAPGAPAPVPHALSAQEAAQFEAGFAKNNYVRPEGQNVGNFITDRPSSRVLAPPGGGSSIALG